MNDGSPPRPHASKPKVLFICHNHPAVRPGGAEAYALELHRHLRDSGELESTFLAQGGTYVSLVNGTPDEYFLYTDGYDYDWTFGTIRHDKELFTKHLRSFLEAVGPDVVHLHHTMFFGYDVLREIRNTLPDAAIVYTLHEYMPICHRQGQMVRTADDEPCLDSSPRRCHECFPEISPQTFYMRKRFVQSHFELVDLFIAPSRFLLERYVDWGIPREKIVAEEYGRTPPPGIVVDDDREVRNRFGFFGQLTPFKGVQVVLEAVELLTGRAGATDPLIRAIEAAAAPPSTEPQTPEPHVIVHGANLDLQPGMYQNRISELLERTRENVTFIGRYDHERIAELMANVDWVIVPSIWWENSPLVIQEAFHFRRPVICSDIGGMAEKVRAGVDGLHFRANDPDSLARTMRKAMDTPGLWERLQGQIKPVYRMDQHLVVLRGVYESLLHREEAAHAG